VSLMETKGRPKQKGRPRFTGKDWGMMSHGDKRWFNLTRHTSECRCKKSYCQLSGYPCISSAWCVIRRAALFFAVCVWGIRYVLSVVRCIYNC
jgi:hypothetical protein